MLIAVKIAVLKSGKHGYEVAQQLRWHPTKLSSVINESYKPSSCEWEDLAAELNVPVHELVNAPNPQPTVTT